MLTVQLSNGFYNTIPSLGYTIWTSLRKTRGGSNIPIHVCSKFSKKHHYYSHSHSQLPIKRVVILKKNKKKNKNKNKNKKKGSLSLKKNTTVVIHAFKKSPHLVVSRSCDFSILSKNRIPLRKKLGKSKKSEVITRVMK